MAKSRPQGWHEEDIKAALRKQHGSLAALSVRWGLHPSAVSGAIKGRKRSSLVEQRIAKALRRPPHTLWPDRWSPEGHPLPRTASNSPAARVPHRQIEESA